MELEATVTIDGVVLTSAQVSVIRCAVTSFRIELSDPECRRKLGPIAEAYDARLYEVEELLVKVRNDVESIRRGDER